jgi:integrase/recombinase XerD
MSQTRQPTELARLLQGFFHERLVRQRNASARTIASYRDAFRLLLQFAAKRLHRAPASLALEDIDTRLVLAFLDHLEKERENSVRSRNARLAAIRSFMHYASFEAPQALPSIRGVLAIPVKRFDRPVVGHLSRDEMQAVLDAPDVTTWSGRRDRVMFETFYNTGARVSEVIGLSVTDLDLGATGAIRFRGKGRKQRLVPLWKSTKARLRDWIGYLDDQAGPLFPNQHRTWLTRSGVEARLKRAVDAARKSCPPLGGRRVSPHTFRHTSAMHLLQAGVDLSVIALWLGHESPVTTHQYLAADLTTRQRALDRLQPPRGKRLRFRAGDRLLHFLDSL